MFKLIKLARNRDGFTLVEMMIVIAVIAILAGVLIPRSGLVQDAAREAGVESNARQVQGILEGMLHRQSTIVDLRSALVNRINRNDIKNPFDTSHYGASTTWADAYAVYVTEDDAPVTANEVYEGLVWVDISNLDDIVITPFGKGGNWIEGASITVR